MEDLDRRTSEYFKEIYETDSTIDEVYWSMKDTLIFQRVRLGMAVSDLIDGVMRLPPFKWASEINDWLERKGL